MSGTAAEAELNFILRDFELEHLEAQGELIQQVCATIQATEPRARITCTDHAAVSQHALLAGKRHAPGRVGARGVPAGRASSRSRSRSAAAPTARG
jgi:hypothetical protein